MTIKPFDERLFRDNDPISRAKVIKYFENQGIKLKENPYKYGVDLIQERNGEVVMGVEVERRHNWDTDRFPFSTIHVPARKGKFVSYEYTTYYCALNKDMTKMFMVKMDDVKNCPRKEINNKYVAEGELFFVVPLNKGRFIYL
jgi:hypothetical protein